MPKQVDLSGMEIGLFHVVDATTQRDRSGSVMWLLRCKCGKEVLRSYSCLRLAIAKKSASACSTCSPEIKRTKLQNIKTIHGCATRGKPSPLYVIWRGMLQRCNYRKAINYRFYGAKGIKVCDEWRDFENFQKWAQANKYVVGLSIDRLNSNGNYEPSNCEWVTRSENARRSNAARSRA